jgi:hypothetical protein
MRVIAMLRQQSTDAIRCSMNCRQFEGAMRSEFGSVDRDEWKLRITREDWGGIPPSEQIAHLVGCSDCQTSLYQFLDVRNFLAYESHPCFHVAYYSADTPERCLEIDRFGLYSINTEKGDRIVIGFCPWCGVTLPTAIRPSAKDS